MAPSRVRPARTLSLLSCAASLLALPLYASHGTGSPPELPHNIHVTHCRMAVEGGTVAARIRFFRHDLEAAVASFYSLDGFSLENSQESDSLFLGYIHERLSLSVGGKALGPTVVSSGEDDEIWWYELLFSRTETITSLSIRNELLFELFSDQKHFTKLTFFPSQVSRSLYFVEGSATYDVVDKTE